MDVLKYIEYNQFSGQSVELHELDALLTVIQDLPHLSLEGIGTMWVCDQESRQHPVLFDTKPDKMTATILKVILIVSEFFFSSSTH